VSDLFDPMRLAYCDTAWSDAELDWIGKAMQLWDGPGQRDDLRATSFRNHMRKDEKLMPRGVGRDNKTKGPPRWRTWSIVLVADLIHTRGPELRRQLKLDLVPEKVLAAHERVALAEKHSKELEDELKRVRKERDKEESVEQHLLLVRVGLGGRKPLNCSSSGLLRNFLICEHSESMTW
jgi:hypothetical protein